MSKIKILHLIAPTQFGGAERVVLSLGEEIDKYNFEIIVGSFINVKRSDNPFITELRKRNIRNIIIWLRRTIDIENVFFLIRMIRINHINIIHTHGYRSDIIGLIAAKITGKPIISTIHGWVPIGIKLITYQSVDRLALRFFNAVIAVSEEIKEGLIKSGIKQERIFKLNNATNIKMVRRDCRIPIEGIKMNPNDKIIGTIGRLNPEKGIDYLIESSAKLMSKYEDLKLLIVGDGPERNKLERTAKRLCIENNVTFTGFRNDVENIYNLLDVFVISSKTEGIPLILLEAMKYSIPVVAMAVGGIKEVIENGVDGFLVPLGDVDQLAKTIELLLKDEHLRKKIAVNAQKKVVEKFDQSSWAREIEKIYNKVIDIVNE